MRKYDPNTKHTDGDWLRNIILTKPEDKARLTAIADRLDSIDASTTEATSRLERIIQTTRERGTAALSKDDVQWMVLEIRATRPKPDPESPTPYLTLIEVYGYDAEYQCSCGQRFWGNLNLAEDPDGPKCPACGCTEANV